MNAFHEAFPELAGPAPVSCAFEMPSTSWPPIVGEYFVLCDNQNCHVAVSTLASTSLADKLFEMKPKDLCIVGKTETENIGIEKIIRNAITNPSIHVLLLAGIDPEGHRSGATLLALCEKGVDDSMRVIGSPGKRPVLNNVEKGEVEAFRNQVKIVDMIGCEDAAKVAGKIKEIAMGKQLPCSNKKFARVIKPMDVKQVEVVQADKSKKVGLDKAGYFVVLPLKDKGILNVEHYSNDNRLLRVIEGKDAASVYQTIVENGWVTQLSHAAYLGKELDRAELSMKLNFKYIQDGI